ncbi:MAG: tetratricopeptide repeat protein [Bryobacteraceae bacterium]
MARKIKHPARVPDTDNPAPSAGSPGLALPPPVFTRGVLTAAALIVFAVTFVFSQVSSFGLVGLDDTTFTSDNFLVTPGLTWNGIQYAFRSFEMGSWHPLTWMSHMLDYSLFGADFGAHHLENLVLHAINCLLLFWLARAMTGRLWPSAIVALLFAVHPMHVEAVAWLADRKGLLATLFWLLSLSFWVKRSPGDRLHYGLSLLSFGLGLLCKPTIVTLPFTLLLVEFWPLRRWRSWSDLPARLPDKAPFFALSILFSVLTYYGQREAGAMAMYGNLGVSARISNAAYGLGMYLIKTFWPSGLALNPPVMGTLPVTVVGLGAGALVVLSALAFWKAREWPALFMGWFWFVGTLIPTIGLVQTGDQAFADRYSYVPHIGLFTLLVAAVVRFVPRERLGTLPAQAAVALLIAGLAWRAHGQTSYWRDAIRQFEHTVSVAPGHTQGRQILARTYMKLKRFDLAEPQIRAAVDADATDPESFRILAEIQYQRGEKEPALASLATAERLAPNSALTQYNRGIVLRGMERYEESAAAYRKAIDLGLLPDTRAEAWYSMGLALNKANKADRAVEAFLKALEVNPYHYFARKNLAFAYLRLQDYASAQREFELLLRTDETDADVVRSLSFLRNRR